MEKAHVATAGDTLKVTIPFAKAAVDIEKRTVSGFGTLDNIDQTDDVVTKEASVEAWETWRGNVREQHSDLAAGRVVNYYPQEFVAADGKTYNGLYVDVYVSKGAPNTWEKVLDGTLSGFSIGGKIQACHTAYLADEDRTVRYITKYRMVELSLVDSPGNELCNVMTINKADDGSTSLTGMATEVMVENVLWCPDDRIAVAAQEEILKCSACGLEMENIGWFEPSKDISKGDAISNVLQAKNKLEKNLDAVKGGSEMSDEVKKEEVKPEEVAEVTEAEKTSEVEEVAKAEEPDLATITKALDEIQATLSATSEKTREETVAEVTKAVDSVKKDFDEKLAELQKSYSKLDEEVRGFKDSLGSVEKSLKGVLDTVEKSSAVKKSVNTEEELKKADEGDTGFWSNRFLPTTYDR